MKSCSRCKELKPSSEFFKNRSRLDGLGGQCKGCHDLGRVRTPRTHAESSAYYFKNKDRMLEKCTRWRKRNPDSFKRYNKNQNLKQKFGITLAEYEQMKARQGGVCAICGNPPGKKDLAVDHDHVTGKIRSLLCSLCNLAIGHLRDDPELVKKAHSYLFLHKAA